MRGDSRSLPKKVKLVDLFSGVVELDESGQADIDFDVPDFNGTLRLMAVAFSADRYGSADAEVTVAAPLVAELSTPRFITPGDQAAVALDLTNLSGATRSVSVKLQALDPLAIADSTRTVVLKDKERKTLRFVATTTSSYGLELMRLVVEGDGLRIERESVLQVQPAHAAERRVRRIRLSPGQEWTPSADLLADWHADSIMASMTLSNRPPSTSALWCRVCSTTPMAARSRRSAQPSPGSLSTTLRPNGLACSRIPRPSVSPG
ncbi:alpha-2-macroglobulin family protein [Bordetella holmesii 70147]|nr:alpha-2-macroglobulin family protein [Bordetella holmesii 70147]